MSKKDDEKSKKEFQRECERYLFKKLEELSEFDKRFTQELEGKYRMWVTEIGRASCRERVCLYV